MAASRLPARRARLVGPGLSTMPQIGVHALRTDRGGTAGLSPITADGCTGIRRCSTARGLGASRRRSREQPSAGRCQDSAQDTDGDRISASGSFVRGMEAHL